MKMQIKMVKEGMTTIINHNVAAINNVAVINNVAAISSAAVTSSKVAAIVSSKVAAIVSSKVAAIVSSKVVAIVSSKVAAIVSNKVAAIVSNKVVAIVSSKVAVIVSSKVAVIVSSKVAAIVSKAVTNKVAAISNKVATRNASNASKAPRPQMRFVPRPQPVEYEEAIIDPNAEVRLNKFMANAGVCSRREADELITKGLVKVNGEVVTELGVKITAKDTVEYNDKIVTSERKIYILLNKPKDCVTTSDDPNGRKTVMDIVKGACEERIYPVGRLDRNTTGVLLLTNDGDLASKLTHPKFVKKKIYQVWTDKPISEEDMQHIADGVELDDGPIHADAVSYVSPTDRKQAGIEIHSGRNRVVRRIFESLGYHVVKLDRVYFAGLTKKNLPRGRWRYLTQEEVNFLKQNSFE